MEMATTDPHLPHEPHSSTPEPYSSASTAHQRRHVHYPTPEISTPPAPHFFLENTSRRHSPNHRRNHPSMSASPPPPAIASSSQLPEPRNSASIPQTDGQDHDRMETDDEPDDSGSESEEEVIPEAEHRPEDGAADRVPPAAQGESMDTSPDNAPADSNNQPNPSIQPAATPHTHVGINIGATVGLDPSSATITLGGLPSEDAGMDGAEVPRPAIQIGISDAAVDNALVREDVANSRRRQRHTRDGDREEDGAGENDSDNSSDDEEVPYWASIVEDTSTPDEQELKAIEELEGAEISAIDHEYWENITFEPLDDPEYIRGEKGRISWTIKDVHGTPENPNRQTIMTSPAVLIGGYYWNIKYYPRGNDGTEQLSVYIECSPNLSRPGEPTTCEMAAKPESGSEGNANQGTTGQGAAEDVQSGSPGSGSTNATTQLNVSEASVQPSEPFQPSEALPAEESPKNELTWGIAAQVSCTIYNPGEPRVHVHQKSSHRYYNDNPDWGWTRFHGPWDEIHKRKKYQRQALLRNDTLAFTAYIQTIEDDTKALWWHPPKDKPQWDNEAMTGVRGFSCRRKQSSALIAAMSTWLHLTPFTQMIDSVAKAYGHPRIQSHKLPVWDEFRRLIDRYGCYDGGTGYFSLAGLEKTMDMYGAEIGPNMDPVLTWETFRRILNYEAAGVDSMEEANTPDNDLFGDFLILKQPDPFINTGSAAENSMTMPKTQGSDAGSEPRSVQETVDEASPDPAKAFRIWESFTGQKQVYPQKPAILQIELHRQKYYQDKRKWKKLTHRIEINEKLTFKTQNFTLFGMIVHSGDLESKEYYSVIRPQGPGTRWMKYAGEGNTRGVSVLTSQQAVRAHEGTEKSEGKCPAVACIVLYVLSDKIDQLLCTPFVGKISGKLHGDLEGNHHDSKIPNHIPVNIFGANLFDGYSGRGLFDIRGMRRVQLQTDQSTGQMVQLHLPRCLTIGELGRCLKECLIRPEGSKADQLIFFPMLVYPDAIYFGNCYFEEFKSTSLDTFHVDGGRGYWLATSPFGSTKDVIQEIFQGKDNITRLANQVISDTQDPQDPADADHHMVGDSAAVEGENEATPQQDGEVNENSNGDNGDAVMAETQEASVDAQIVHNEPESLAHATPPQIPQLMICIFMKIFDLEVQRLRGVTSYFLKPESKIMEQLKDVLNLEPNETWDFYEENTRSLTPGGLIKPNETFHDRRYTAAQNGAIFIAQRRPTAAQIVILEAEGKCTSPAEFVQYLRGHDNPSFFRDHFTRSYFGRDYLSVSLKCGRPHGHGTHIALSGDAYTGNFIADSKSGDGRMAYANGDTYTGQWRANEPNGQGTMVYAKTGNTYTGGFRKRKRHGKGTMQFKVADEELQLCKICYESEQDALFYTCGHVVACEECARQVEVCPVCRATVRAVVRIYRT